MTGSGIGDFLVGGVLAIGGALTGQGWLVSIGASIAFSGASQMISPRAEKMEGAQLNVQSTQAAVPVVYGQSKVGVSIFDTRVDSDDRDILFRGGIISIGSEDGSGIEDIVAVYFDEELAISSPTDDVDGIEIGTEIQSPWRQGDGSGVFGANDGNYLGYCSRSGNDDQTAVPDLAGRFGALYDDVYGKGLAWMGFYMHWSEDIWRGIPNITVELKGNHVYDPRDSTWKYSDNPALCILDYLTSKRYGAGIPYAARDGGTEDEIDEQSFIDAANYAEETVSTPEGTGDRFTLNGIVPTDRPVAENVAKMLSSCRGDLVWQNGTYRLVIRKATTPTTYEITEDKIIGDWEFRREGAANVPNSVEATYVRANNRYQPDEIVWPYPDATNNFLTADDGYENVMELDLPYTTTEYEAYHTALVMLKEQRADAVIQVTLQESALQLEVGDLVPFTHASAGWDQKEFWVIGLSVNPDRTVNLVLREYDSSAYTLDTLNTEDPPPGSNLPDPLSVDPPTGLSLSSNSTTALDTQEGNVVPRIFVEWTGSTDSLLAYYEIRYKRAADSEWDHVKDPTKEAVQAYIAPVTDQELYDVEIRAVNSWGAHSAWVSDQITADTKPADPQTAGNFVSVQAVLFSPGLRQSTLELSYEVGKQTRSIRVQYDYDSDGDGLSDTSVDYTFDHDGSVDPDGVHQVQDELGAIKFWADDETGYSNLTITPYNAAGGGGSAGTSKTAIPQDPATSGMAVGARFDTVAGLSAPLGSDFAVIDEDSGLTLGTDGNGRPQVSANVGPAEIKNATPSAVMRTDTDGLAWESTPAGNTGEILAMVTAATNDVAAFQTPASLGLVEDTRQVLGGTGLTGGGALSSDVTLDLSTPVSTSHGGTGADMSTDEAKDGAVIVTDGGPGFTSTPAYSGVGARYLQNNAGVFAWVEASIILGSHTHSIDDITDLDAGTSAGQWLTWIVANDAWQVAQWELPIIGPPERQFLVNTGPSATASWSDLQATDFSGIDIGTSGAPAGDVYGAAATFSGAVTTGGNLTIPSGSKLHLDGGVGAYAIANNNYFRWQTPSGYVDIGSNNTSSTRFYTDRPHFFFANGVVIAGTIRPYYDSTYDLGTSSYRWRGVYVDDLDVAGTVYGGKSILAYYTDDTRYGLFGVYNDSGDRGGYFGYGNGTTIIDLRIDFATTLQITGGDVDITAGDLDVSGALTLGTPLAVAEGGTGLDSGYALGDLLYGQDSTTLVRLTTTGASAGDVLTLNGTLTPSWAAPDQGAVLTDDSPPGLGYFYVGTGTGNGAHGWSGFAIEQAALAEGFLKKVASGDATWEGLVAGDLPSLDASKITTGTFADARIAQSNVTQHQAALSIGAGQITSGLLSTARGGTGVGTPTAGSVLWSDGTNPLIAATSTAGGSHYLQNDGGIIQWVAFPTIESGLTDDSPPADNRFYQATGTGAGSHGWSQWGLPTLGPSERQFLVNTGPSATASWTGLQAADFSGVDIGTSGGYAGDAYINDLIMGGASGAGEGSINMRIRTGWPFILTDYDGTGTRVGQARMDLAADAWKFYADGGTGTNVRLTLSSALITLHTPVDVTGDLDVGGDTQATGTAYAADHVDTSHRRWKDDIRDWTLDRASFMALRPRTWVWNGLGMGEPGTRGFGYVSDEVASFFATPDLAAVYHNRIGVQTVLMVQDHERRITTNEERIAFLENRIAELEAQIDG